MRVKPATDELPAPPELEEPTDSLESALNEAGITRIINNEEIRRLIQGAMDGSLPLDRPLEVNQPAKLSPRMIQAALLTVGNYHTTTEIAELTGANYVYLTKIIRHPYMRRILAVANTHAIGDAALFSRKLRREAPRMLEIVKDIAEDEEASKSLRVRAAFGWLDRAHGAPIARSEHKESHRLDVTVTHERSKLIADAIREAKAPQEVQEAEFEVESSENGAQGEDRRAS